MQCHWLNKKNNNNLIVFFAGWSFDYFPFEFLDCNNNDVLAVYDYNEITEIPEFKDYKYKMLITWSMGVYIAYLLKDKFKDFDKKIAVNGTVYPVDDNYGIPHKTFNLTLKYAQTGLEGKFYKNVFNNDDLYKKYTQNPVQRTIENRVSELHKLNNMIQSADNEYNGHFYDKAIVSNNDKIIPTKNQIAFWKNKAVLIDCGHFPFYNYKSWDEICK